MNRPPAPPEEPPEPDDPDNPPEPPELNDPDHPNHFVNAGKGDNVFTYDKLYRMISSVDGNNGLTTYVYDTVGNLLTETNKNQVTSYQYNIMNQLVRKETNSDTSLFTYDKRGNLVREDTKNKDFTYVFDATNRLVEGVNDKNNTSKYTYNALFKRINITYVMNSGQSYSRDYVTDYTSNLKTRDLMIYAHGDYEQSHTWRGDERVLQITNRSNGQERLLYVHEDFRGTTRFYSRIRGQVYTELEFDAWGFPTSPAKYINNDRGTYITANFTGHYFDVVLDMYFAQARFYDAQNRHWISRDPAKDGLNWYRYCNNNPKTFVDPTGLVAVIYDHDAKHYVYLVDRHVSNNHPNPANHPYAEDFKYTIAEQHRRQGYTVFQLSSQEQRQNFRAATDRAGVSVVPAPNSKVFMTPTGEIYFARVECQNINKEPIDILVTGPTVSGQFREEIFFGSGSASLGYLEIMERIQVDSSNESRGMLGIFSKASGANVQGRVGVGDENLSVSLKGVGDALTATAQAGAQYKDGIGAGAQAKASLVSGRATTHFDLYGWEIEVGVSGHAISIGAEIMAGYFPEEGFTFKAGGSALFGTGFQLRIKPN